MRRLLILLAALLAFAAPAFAADRLVVFAAASLKTALDAAAGAYLAGGGGEGGTRFDLLSKSLVVVARKAAAIEALALDRDALAKATGYGRLATGEVKTVLI